MFTAIRVHLPKINIFYHINKAITTLYSHFHSETTFLFVEAML